MKKLKIIGLIILGVQLSANLVLADTYCEIITDKGTHLIKLIDDKYYFNDIEIEKDVLIDDIEFTFDNERNLSFKTVKGNLIEGLLFLSGGGLLNGSGTISSCPPISKKNYSPKNEINFNHITENKRDECSLEKPKIETNYINKTDDRNDNNESLEEFYYKKTSKSKTVILKINDKIYKAVKKDGEWYGGESLNQKITERVIIGPFEYWVDFGNLYFESLENGKNGTKVSGHMNAYGSPFGGGYITLMGNTVIFQDEPLSFIERLNYQN